jgi:predicted Zn-dependent protease
MPGPRSLLVVLAWSVACGLALSWAPPAHAAAGSPGATTESKKSDADRQRHAQTVQAVGRYEDERVQEYVNAIGQRVAASSDRPDLQFTFTVLDSDEINAFAAPGGYIYVYRGLLAHLNSEAELAAVLGHEIGHVTARHIARRQAGATAAGVGATLLGVLTGQPGLIDVAGLAGSALVASYSREQEMEADELGVKFTRLAGYDPQASLTSLEIMRDQELSMLDRARKEKQSLGGGGQGVMSSHPDIDKRISAVATLVGQPKAPESQPAPVDPYLVRIDGLAFGKGADQGVVRGSRFYHAGMGVTLAFPSNWTVENQRTRVLAVSQAPEAMIEVSAMAIPPQMQPREFLGRLLQGQPTSKAEPLQANGLDGYRVNLRSKGLPWGNQGPASVAVLYNNGLAYIFVGAPRLAAGFASFEPVFVSSVKTFRRLRDNEYTTAEPDRIRVITARPETKIADLAASSPIGKYADEDLRLLNALYPNKEPVPGQQLKIVE